MNKTTDFDFLFFNGLWALPKLFREQGIFNFGIFVTSAQTILVFLL